jgi:hypothetical protein
MTTLNSIPCSCGSGLTGEAQYDARGIYLTGTCSKCHDERLKCYRAEVLYNPFYETCEPIEPDDY